MITDLFCPLKFMQGAGSYPFVQLDPRCFEGQCAWWDKAHQQCVLLSIASLGEHLDIVDAEIEEM